MPYRSTTELPEPVRRAIPSNDGRRLFMNVVNSQMEGGKDEKVAFASAWAALKAAGYVKEKGKWIKKMEITKYAIDKDVFTMREEAAARSLELGLGGAVHVHERETGQAVFMPGESHEAYMAYIGGKEVAETQDNVLSDVIYAIISAVLDKQAQPMNLEGKILKADDEQRVVYGWASVITEKGEPVVDRQGDIISADELMKAANAFMLDARIAKAMHEGDAVGEVIHSLPLTKDIGESLGISADREGWIIAMKIHSDEIWKRVKSGELAAFSIGGKAIREDVNAD